MPPRLPSCRQCQTSKTRCGRELTSCQSCVNRGKATLCVYDASSSNSAGPRSCQPCRISKKRCGHELPSCQTCVSRGKSTLCLYDASSPDGDNWHPQRQRRQRREIISPSQHAKKDEQFNHETKDQQDFGHTVRSPTPRADLKQPAQVDKAVSAQESKIGRAHV